MNRFFKPGQTVLFQGDSITDCGRWYYDNNFGFGYAWKVATIYNSLFGDDTVSFENRENPQEPHAAYPPVSADSGVTFINKGWAGNRVLEILARYQEDIVDLKPDFISILAGINEVLHYYEGSSEFMPPEVFEKHYETLLTQIKRDLPNTKIMMIEPFVLPSAPDFERLQAELNDKVTCVRRLARKYADYYLPLAGILAAKCLEFSPEQLAKDGIHPTPLAHGIIAHEYMKVLEIL